MSRALLLFTSLAIIGFRTVSGSSGDRNPAFVECLIFCKSSGCTTAYQQPSTCSDVCNHSFSSTASLQTGLLLQLRLTLWDCPTDCKYLCMHAVQAALLETYGQSITSAVKYHGKWPFVRAWGIVQEPASVIFSLGNLLVHMHGFWTVLSLLRLPRRQTIREHRTLTASAQAEKYSTRKACWLVYATLHILAWIASALLHTRDTHLTERLDYCFADVAIGWGLLMATTRAAVPVLQVPLQAAQQTIKPNLTNTRSKVTVAVITLILSLCLAAQLYYMLTIEFNHQWNVQVGIVAGAVQAVLWLFVCKQENHPGRHWLHWFLALLTMSALLEVGDFPPTRLSVLEVDAHALWHAATFLITPLLYRFVWYDVTRELSDVSRAKHD